MKKLLIPCLFLLPAGLCHEPIEVEDSDKLWFCDAEPELRRFTQEEIDWRTANAQRNLVRDYQSNLTYERECVTQTEGR